MAVVDESTTITGQSTSLRAVGRGRNPLCETPHDVVALPEVAIRRVRVTRINAKREGPDSVTKRQKGKNESRCKRLKPTMSRQLGGSLC